MIGERRGRLSSCQCHQPQLKHTRGILLEPSDSAGSPRRALGGCWGEDAPGVQGKVGVPIPAWAGAKLLPPLLPLPGRFPTQNLPAEPEEPSPNPVIGTGLLSRGASAEPGARPRCHILVVATGAPQPGPLLSEEGKPWGPLHPPDCSKPCCHFPTFPHPPGAHLYLPARDCPIHPATTALQLGKNPHFPFRSHPGMSELSP